MKFNEKETEILISAVSTFTGVKTRSRKEVKWEEVIHLIKRLEVSLRQKRVWAKNFQGA